MSILSAVITLAVLPVYLLIRHPYARLPLHIDTGFYVANAVITRRRLAFRDGWNATYAGGSKVVPELFYSLAYRQFGRRDYAQRSRFCFSLYNFLTAVVVGLLSWHLFGHPAFYFAGFITFALISSEPHWGGYHECGEQFEVPWQAGAVLLMYIGVQTQVWGLCVLAATIWAAEVFFIKLSSAAAFAVFFAGMAFLHPWTATAALGGGSIAATAYILWLVWLGQRPHSLLARLWGHEVSYGRRFDVRAVLHRLREKATRLADTVVRQPFIPGVAVVALILGPHPPGILWLYAAAVVATYLVQAADVRYYLIPLQPILAVLAAGGAMALNASAAGQVILLALAAAWLVHNVYRPLRLNLRSLNRWVWFGMISPANADRNLALQQVAPQLAEICRGRSLFVYGPYNQAYALSGTSYATPLVSAGGWLDAMETGWQAGLSLRLSIDPPTFILDTDRCFDAAATRQHLLLDYRLICVFADHLRLYALRARDRSDDQPAECATMAPQTREHLRGEEERSSAVTAPAASESGHCREAAVRAILTRLVEIGVRRAAVYGAGRTTTELLDVLQSAPLEIVAILDDDTNRHGRCLGGWPIHPLSDVPPLQLDAVLISSDRFAQPMRKRCLGLARQGIIVAGLDDDPERIQAAAVSAGV